MYLSHTYKCGCCCNISEVPCCITQCFGEDIDLTNGEGSQSNRLFVTLGQFSIIRLERDIQLLMPAYDVCMPEKDCSCTGGDAEDPCEVFERFAFPFEEFFPAGGETYHPHDHGCESGQTGGSNGCCNQNGAGCGNNTQTGCCCKKTCC